MVMEPVKGGQLVNMSKPMAQIVDGLGGGSRASYALRFAAGFSNVIMVLSGMGNMDMVNDNIRTMKDFKPLNAEELEALKQAAAIYWGTEQIPCTGCRYCVDGCPKEIPIPDLFAAANAAKNAGTETDISGISGGKPEDCIWCGKCEKSCPQVLPIRALLRKFKEA
jgi:predicted aldo/keto reductase-like oxidoreductase